MTRCLVVGDLMHDIIASPSPMRDVDWTVENYVDATVQMAAGGSGFALARAASLVGFDEVMLVHSWPDEIDDSDRDSATVLAGALRAYGIRSILNPVPHGRLGRAVIGYFAEGRRMMFGDPGVNRVPLLNRTISEATNVVDRETLICISGYALFRSGGQQQTLDLMAAAQSRGGKVVLDVVPHSIARSLALTEFESMVTHVDLLSSELGTLDRFVSRKARDGTQDDKQFAVQHFSARIPRLLVFPHFGSYYLIEGKDETVAGSFVAQNAVERRGAVDMLLLQLAAGLL